MVSLVNVDVGRSNHLFFMRNRHPLPQFPLEETAYPCVITPPQYEAWGESLRLFLREKGGDYVRAIALCSSGSSGGALKATLFKIEALMTSAQGVNKWLGADEGGDWCCPLPAHHIGGWMTYCRAFCAGTKVWTYDSAWNPELFCQFLTKSQAAWLSLVPAQVVDIVSLGLVAPASLRCTVVGGGGLDIKIGEQARALGWNVVQSYGMTESASQLATSLPSEPYRTDRLPILPHWECQVTEGGQLQIRGKARFFAYAKQGEDGSFFLEEYSPEEWWTSTDKVFLQGRYVTFLSRTDRVVKILGVLVDMDALETEFRQFFPEGRLCTIAHPRLGQEIIACAPLGEAVGFEDAVSRWNHERVGLYRIYRHFVMNIPYNIMGKIQRAALKENIEKICLEK